MTLEELTKLMHQFVQTKGWYNANSPRPQTSRNIAISLSLEASEILEHFQWSEDTTNPGSLADELADVALYLLQLASINNIDLEEAILDKLDKNYGRVWDDDNPTQPVHFNRYPFNYKDLLQGVRDFLPNPSARIQNIEDLPTPSVVPGMLGVGGKTKTSTFVIEILHNNQRQLLALSLLQGSATEMRRLYDFYRYMQIHIPIVIPYYINGDGQSWLVVESHEDLLAPHQWRVDHYREAADNLARLHDRFWGLQEDLAVMGQLWHPLNRDFMATKRKTTQAIEKVQAVGYPGLDTEDAQWILQALKSQIGDLRKQLKDLPMTLLHGNYWADNIACPTNKGSRQIVAGWQYATVGPAILDVVMFQKQTACHLTPAMSLDAAIDRYREQLSERRGDEVWDRQTWQKEYDLAALWVFATQWMPWIAALSPEAYTPYQNAINTHWLPTLKDAISRLFDPKG